MRIRLLVMTALAALTLSTAACGGKKGDTTPGGGGGGGSGGGEPAAGSLFDRIGGKPAIEKVVDDFLKIVLADARINKRFDGKIDAANLRKQLIDQICDVTSGGTQCKYTGKDMKTAHTGMKITAEEFTALVEDLVKALKDNGVKDKEIGEIGVALGGLKDQIVGQ